MQTPSFVVHLCSGGIDSVTLLYDLVRQKCKVHCLLVDYGQTHKQEIGFAKLHCKNQGVLWSVVELPQIPGSKLTDGFGSDIVPNRNMILCAVAASLASSVSAEIVTIGCNFDDAVNFPDCRHGFFIKLNESLREADVRVEVCAPYVHLTKAQIVALAKDLNIDLDQTWSCYRGGTEPCGECLACRKRKEALA